MDLVVQYVGKELLAIEKEKYMQQKNIETIKRFSQISKREKEVLILLSQGKSTKLIAQYLNISPKNCRNA